MIYCVVYENQGVSGPCGNIFLSREEAVVFAKDIAKSMFEKFGDPGAMCEWVNSGGDKIDPFNLQAATEVEEMECFIEQVSDVMKTECEGFVDIFEYEDFFQLCQNQNVEQWCSDKLKEKIRTIRKEYFGLIDQVSCEWCGI